MTTAEAARIAAGLGALAMIFENREDAGRQLANRLQAFASRQDGIVLGIPRGGVTVAFQVAQALHLPLDVFLAHKLGVPGHEELAFGAVAAGGERTLDAEVMHAAGIDVQQIEQVTAEVTAMLDRRAALYRGERPAIELAGRTVILVDDGVATGSSMLCAVRALRTMQEANLVVAVPLAPASTCAWLRNEVDELVCLYAPEEFYAVGGFYRDFAQVEDEEVIGLLRRAEAATGPRSR